jgi:hypothetical protein
MCNTIVGAGAAAGMQFQFFDRPFTNVLGFLEFVILITDSTAFRSFRFVNFDVPVPIFFMFVNLILKVFFMQRKFVLSCRPATVRRIMTMLTWFGWAQGRIDFFTLLY